MPLLLPNQQCQSTEGNSTEQTGWCKQATWPMVPVLVLWWYWRPVYAGRVYSSWTRAQTHTWHLVNQSLFIACQHALAFTPWYCYNNLVCLSLSVQCIVPKRLPILHIFFCHQVGPSLEFLSPMLLQNSRGNSPHVGCRVGRIDPLHFLAGCRNRWLNQALSVFSFSIGRLACSKNGC